MVLGVHSRPVQDWSALMVRCSKVGNCLACSILGDGGGRRQAELVSETVADRATVRMRVRERDQPAVTSAAAGGRGCTPGLRVVWLTWLEGLARLEGLVRVVGVVVRVVGVMRLLPLAWPLGVVRVVGVIRLLPLAWPLGLLRVAWPPGLLPLAWPLGLLPLALPLGLLPLAWPPGLLPLAWPLGLLPLAWPLGLLRVGGPLRLLEFRCVGGGEACSKSLRARNLFRAREILDFLVILMTSILEK